MTKGRLSSCECTVHVQARSSSRSSGTCACVACVRRRGIAENATAMEADSLLKFGYHVEREAAGVGACVVLGFSLIPLTCELRSLCRTSYTVSVLGQTNDLCFFT